MIHTAPAVTLSVRIAPETRDQLEQLSDATGRTKSFLAAEAIENYLETQTWQINAIKKAVTKANSKNAHFVEHHEIKEWVKSWSNADEKDMPK